MHSTTAPSRDAAVRGVGESGSQSTGGGDGTDGAGSARAAASADDAVSARPGAPAPVDGHRERKKRETRRALRMAALTLVEERGLDGVTIEQIAAAADVSPRTFFNYFSSKEDALVGNDPELVADLGRNLARRPAEEPPLEALRAAFHQVAGAISANRPVWELRMRVVRANPSLRAGLIGATAEVDRMLTEVIAERTASDPTDLYPSLTAAVAASAARVAIQHSRLSTGEDGRLLTDVIDHAFDLLIAGLPVPDHPR